MVTAITLRGEPIALFSASSFKHLWHFSAEHLGSKLCWCVRVLIG